MKSDGKYARMKGKFKNFNFMHDCPSSLVSAITNSQRYTSAYRPITHNEHGNTQCD